METHVILQVTINMRTDSHPLKTALFFETTTLPHAHSDVSLSSHNQLRSPPPQISGNLPPPPPRPRLSVMQTHRHLLWRQVYNYERHFNEHLARGFSREGMNRRFRPTQFFPNKAPENTQKNIPLEGYEQRGEQIAACARRIQKRTRAHTLFFFNRQPAGQRGRPKFKKQFKKHTHTHARKRVRI